MLLMIGVFAPSLARAQTTVFVDPVAGLTLEQAVRLALDDEPSLRAVVARIDVARGEAVQAGLRPNPTGSFMQQKELGGTAAETRAELNWPLDLFRRDARVAVARHETEVATYAAGDAARLLAARVREQYGSVAEAVRNVRVLAEVADAAGRHLALLSARVDEGAGRPLDHDVFAVEVARIEAARALEIARAEAELFGLRSLLGMRPSEPLAIHDTLDDLVQAEDGARVLPGPGIVVEERDDIRVAQAQLAAAAARVRLAEEEGRFDASIVGGYMRMTAPFMDGPSHQAAIGVSVTLPLRDRNQGTIAAAEARRTAAAAEAEAVTLDAGREVAAARVRLAEEEGRFDASVVGGYMRMT
ncbi:MAG: TolC family protein, partial [Acidobacteriota bacterium]|nr:TolC family protein [Acidobacteriota bacterium]